MITLLAPWALFGLLSLPVLLLLDRRRRRAVPVEVPSLLFFAAAEDADAAARRPRLDADLVLALAAASLLTLAAAAPVVALGGAGRTIRVVVDSGPAMSARAPDGTTAAARAEDAVDALRRALKRDDELLRVDAADPSLVTAARAGAAALRVLVTDRARPDAAPDVVVVAVGDPAAADVGVAAVDLDSASGARRVFVNVRNDGPAERRRTLSIEGGGAVELAIPAFGAASATLDAPAGASDSAEITVRLADPGGALAEGDEVRISAAPVKVFIATGADGLPAAHQELVRRTLSVVAPGYLETPRDEAALRFTAARRGADPSEDAGMSSASDGPGPSSGLEIVLHPIARGASSARATPEGPFEPLPPDLSSDLDPTGCELRYAADVSPRAPWPIIRRRGEHLVEWLPDPLAGAPSPADHPIWPLFVENAVRVVAGRAGPAGHRVRGLLDPGALRLGRDRIAFDARALAATPYDRRAPERPLRAPLIALAVVAAALLWARGARARRASSTSTSTSSLGTPPSSLGPPTGTMRAAAIVR